MVDLKYVRGIVKADAPLLPPSSLTFSHHHQHPPWPVCRVTLSFRCVTERLSCRTGGINYRPWLSRCHCSVINGLSRRCAIGPGLTMNSTGIQRQTHTHTQSCTHTTKHTHTQTQSYMMLLNHWLTPVYVIFKCALNVYKMHTSVCLHIHAHN